KDFCSIYAVLFKTNEQVQFLYGDDIGNSPQIIARAEIKEDAFRPDNWIFFEVDFDYHSYSTPFSWDELQDNVYKITLVCASSSNGQNYEGRPGNTLIVDDLSLYYDTSGF
ncbi:MAG: PCMD domain-containing protein, partial [Tannerella sp.]|nr:PCMD domain-containing protein [Tannerella sp.]